MVGGRLEAWSLDCRRAPLRDDLGPPDFYPPSVGCLEDALDETSVQNGWKDSAEDLNVSEAKESALTLASAADLWEGSRVRGHRKRLWQSLHLLQKSKRAAQGASSQVSPAGPLAPLFCWGPDLPRPVRR